MANTFQSGFETTLALRLDTTDTTATLASVPTVTKGRMYLDNGEQKEWIKFTGVSGSTITGLVRGLSQTADPATAGTGLTWIAGTKIKLVAMHDQLLDKNEGDDPLISAVVYADTTARDTALGGDGVATINYTNIKTTADGLFWRYNTTTNVWESIDTGTVTPNASDTVAGKVEISTQAEFDAGTATGGTGASVVATNDQIRKQINTATAKTTPVNADSIGIADSAASGVIKKTTLTQFKAASDMQATTTTSGFVELATNAEVYAGTDETRYINSKQRTPLVAVLHTTRAMNATSGSVNIAHGLGYAPKYITCIAKYSAIGSNSDGFSNGTTHRCTRYGYSKSEGSTAVEALNVSGACIEIVDDDGGGSGNDKVWQTATASFDATNIVLSWTKGTAGAVSEPATEIQITILAIA